MQEGKIDRGNLFRIILPRGGGLRLLRRTLHSGLNLPHRDWLVRSQRERCPHNLEREEWGKQDGREVFATSSFMDICVVAKCTSMLCLVLRVDDGPMLGFDVGRQRTSPDIRDSILRDIPRESIGLDKRIASLKRSSLVASRAKRRERQVVNRP